MIFWQRMLAGRPGFFEHRRIVGIAVLLALVISLPMLGTGIFLDDYGQRIKLLTGDDTIFQLFGYGETLIPSGELPWWTHPDARIRFFRPLGAWLTQLDYALWPNTLWAMHLHSILWYGLLVAVAGMVYRALMPAAWAAGLAVVLFAVDAHHAGAVTWLCNRNVLISMIACLLCLHCHRLGSPVARGAAALLFMVGLGAGESALAISGYLLAHELFLAQDGWGRRFLRLLPYGLIGIAYFWFWRHGGYGASGPGFYIDPGRNPALFVQEMLFRVPAFLTSQFYPPPAEILGYLESPPVRERTQLPAQLYALGGVAVLAWFFWPLLRRSPHARFYAFGMSIALLPLSGITMVSRVLWYVGFGATGLLALYVHEYRQPEAGLQQQRFSRAFLGIMLILHLWLSPLLYAFAARVPDLLDRKWDTQVVNLPNASGNARRVLLLACRQYVTDVTFPLLKDRAFSLGSAPTRPAPTIAKIFALTEGAERYTLTRPDADTLVIRTADAFDTLRPLPYRFAAGDTVRHEGIEIEVLSVTTIGAPNAIRFRFQPGELDGFEVMEWQRDKFVPASLPAVGGSREIRLG